MRKIDTSTKQVGYRSLHAAARRKAAEFYEKDRYEYAKEPSKRSDWPTARNPPLCESGSRLHNSGESAKNDTPRGSIETGKDPRKWRWRARGAPAAHQRRRVLVARLLSGLLLSGEAKWKSLLLAGTRSIYKQRV